MALIISIAPTANLSQSYELMNKNKIHHLLIIKDDTLIGVLSDRDILSHNKSPQFMSLQVSTTFQSQIIAARETCELRIMAHIFLDENISALPILNQLDERVGIITKSDILKILTKNILLDIMI